MEAVRGTTILLGPSFGGHPPQPAAKLSNSQTAKLPNSQTTISKLSSPITIKLSEERLRDQVPTQVKMAAPAVSNTFVGLKRTICWDIRGPYPGKGRVPIPEWMEFLEQDVGLDLKELSSALQHSITGHLLIQFASEDAFQKILTKAGDGVMWSKYSIRVFGWSAGEETIKVHLHNIFCESDLDAAIREMSKHGKIIRQEVHKYKQAPTLSNGIVSLTMRLKQEAEMPEFIYEEIAGNTIQVFSDKHQRTCWRCLGKGHVAAFCKRPLKTQETASKTTTWAKIEAGPTAVAAPEPQATDSADDVMQEILDSTDQDTPSEKQAEAMQIAVTPVKTKSKKSNPKPTPYKPTMDRHLSESREPSTECGQKRQGVQAAPQDLEEKRTRIQAKLQNA